MLWTIRQKPLTRKLLLVIGAGLLAISTAWAQVPTTQITDTVFRADGTTATGTIVISWTAFTTANGQAVSAGSTAGVIAPGGVVSVQLAPNAGATPAGSYYTVVYHLDDGSVNREYWVVPTSATAVSISSIKTAVAPATVAVQAVTKSYVDTAIAAALTGAPLSAAAPYINKGGDTMGGPLALPADPLTSNQASNKHYVDLNVASLTSGLTQKISTTPQGSQAIAQPAGTQLQTNHMNGVLYASQYLTGRGDNGIANVLSSTDCAVGCEAKAEQNYNSSEIYRPFLWNSGLHSGTHLEDARGGEQRDSYFNPVDLLASGNDAGQVIDVTSTRDAASVHQQTGSEEPTSLGLLINHQGLAGGSNLFPASIHPGPYFKSTYTALSVNGNYNTLGQHVLASHVVNCYGVGDCLAGSQFVTSSGGFRDEADEGTHPFDLQVQEDVNVFQGTCNSGCTPGSTSVMVAGTSGPGTQGEGRYLIDKNPARVISTGALIGGAIVAGGAPGPTAVFSGSSFPVSTFLATGQIVASPATQMAPGTVTFPIATTGLPQGFAANTAALPSPTGVACVTDLPNAFNPSNYEMVNYTVVDATHLTMTFNKVHAARTTITVGGLCGYGLEQTVDTAQGIRQVFPVIGSYSATGLFYAGGQTPIVGITGQTSAYLNVSLPIANVSRSNNVVTVTLAGGLPVDVNGLTMQVTGVGDASFNGSYQVTTTGSNSLTFAETGANGTSSGGAISLLTGGFALYPMAEVLGVLNPATKAIDGQMILAPNTVAWAQNDQVEEPHYFQELVYADMEAVSEVTPRPTVPPRAGIAYQNNNGPGMRGWSVINQAPASNYFGNGGTHSPPDAAYEELGIWRRTFDVQAGETALMAVHCNSHGCGNWNSGYNLFELDSNGGQSQIAYQPLTSSLTFNMRGTIFGFGPQGFSAGTVNAGVVNASTLNGALNASSISSGTVNAVRLPIFGASGPAHAPGVVPDPGASAGAARYLREDGSWTVPSGSGAGGGGATGTASITGGSISGATINASPIGNTTPAAGSFTNITATGLSITSPTVSPQTIPVFAPNLGGGAQFCQGFGKSLTAHNSTFYCWWNTATPYGSLETYAGGDPIQVKGSAIWLNGGPVAIGSSAGIGSALPALLNVGSSAQFQVDGNGNVKAANFAGILAGATGAIGGTALTSGGCASGTVAVSGANVGAPVAVSASDGTLPSGSAIVSAAVTTAGTVTVQVCAANAFTPPAKSYNVRVLQ